MDLLRVAVTSLVSLAALFLLTKLMGNKQVSQMNLFDYIIGISIGSIAAEMATELDTPENSLLAMAVYAVVAVCISLLTNKSLAARRIMTGKPLVLLEVNLLDVARSAQIHRRDVLLHLRVVALLVALVVHEHAANLNDSPYEDGYANEAHHNLAYTLALELLCCHFVRRLCSSLAVVVIVCVIIVCFHFLSFEF